MTNATSFLKVSDNHRFIVKEDGTPFFWLGDTAWQLFHRLDREEAELYLQNRAERRFTVIQAVILAEYDGLRTANRYGRIPLRQDESGAYDPERPDVSGAYSYWDHIDFVIDKAGELGLYMALLPAWGDKFNIMWGKGPEIFTSENARAYGWWLGERYKDRSNVLWILGGDRPLENENHVGIVRGMAEGLAAAHGGRQLMSFHPPGYKSSSLFVHEERWLNFHMVQSGHNCLEADNYKLIESDYGLLPVRPVMESEPCYEEHTLSSRIEDGFYTDYEVRRAAYWGLFAGGFGHTYGHHAVWFMNTEPRPTMRVDWRTAIESPGSAQMRHVRHLMESRPFLARIPDQQLVEDAYDGLDHIRCTRGDNYALIYIPTGKPCLVRMGRISGEKSTAFWYDPRTGNATSIGEYDNRGSVVFTPPAAGRGNDWILVIDDSSRGFAPPGAIDRHKK